MTVETRDAVVLFRSGRELLFPGPCASACMQPDGWARPSHVRAAWLHSVAPTPRCQTLRKLASHSTSRCCSPPEPQRRDVGGPSWSAMACAHAAMLRTGVGTAFGDGRCFQGAVRRHFDSLASRQRWPHGARACHDGRAICGGNRLRAALQQQRQPADLQRDFIVERHDRTCLQSGLQWQTLEGLCQN